MVEVGGSQIKDQRRQLSKTFEIKNKSTQNVAQRWRTCLAHEWINFPILQTFK